VDGAGHGNCTGDWTVVAKIRLMDSVRFKRVCVFCGSNPGRRAVYVRAAEELGRQLAADGTDVVYGGGRRGLMGALADAAMGGGGRVIGVMPQALVDMEVAHQGLSEMHIVGSMHERKALMAQLSDAFLILPGGWGTMDEMCEALTWAQLGIHNKPCGLWNVEGYFDCLLAFLDHAVREELLKAKDRERLLVGKELTEVLAAMRSCGLE
jgi:uncharacterized protein (TIGR00730 family)